ncbi:hypothetical protein HMPREF0658_1311 [Hoylesella marshii DSM 16973 = JCM 13450]|uniref:Uncharacterized protein n=1 Tax=Hoylesella marshii DSM 16973 = JCM 13450 TaxID=862515 RepID=E0NSV9_9BACT|nr:hypothetical protein HMPREF0658_1311 [Hoylesella marshii DSM 16973 = JCM 13450]
MYVAFEFQVENTSDGYVVSAFVCEPPSTYRTWKPLRNFGDRQSDAIIFKNEDCPKLNEISLKVLIRDYCKDVKYIRVGSREFVKQKND